MPQEFQYDAFFSYSSKDRAVVQEITQRLAAAGLRIWLDVEQIKPGDSIPAKIEEGLENSRILVLCMSANAFGEDWPTLESYTFRFRDPLNKERRFLPLRLDGAPLKGSLAQFLYIDWRPRSREAEYLKLLKACQAEMVVPLNEELQRRFLARISSFGHTERVLSVALSPDGLKALSSSEDGTVRIWDIRNGQCLRVLVANREIVSCVGWSPGGEQVVTGANDKMLRIWDVVSGSCVQVLKGHSGGVLSVAWGPESSNRFILSSSIDKTIRLWDSVEGRCLRVFRGHTARVNSVAWNSNGQLAVSGSVDKTVRLWEVSTGRCRSIFEGHSASVNCVVWSSGGEEVASGSFDKNIRVWDVSSGRCLQILKGHKSSIRSIAWKPWDTKILSGSNDNTIRLWDRVTGQCISIIKGHKKSVRSVLWHSDGQKVISGAEDNSLRVWDVDTCRCLLAFEGHADTLRSVAWSPDGMYILSGANDNTLRIWDVRSGCCLKVFEGHTSFVRCVAWSPDGKQILSGAGDNTVRLWEVATGCCLRILEGHTAFIRCVAWSPDDRRILSGSADNTLRVWDVVSGRCLHVLEGHFAIILSAEWCGDSRKILSGSAGYALRLWDADNGRCLRVLESHTDGVLSISWSPDGLQVLSGSVDNTVRVWEVASGRCLRILEGHTNSVSSVAWSPNGRFGLSGSEDNTLRVWDISTGRCIFVLECKANDVLSVAWSCDSQRIYSAAKNGVWREWDFSSLADLNSRILFSKYDNKIDYQSIQYSNAKVLLVGESGVGKTGLSKRLALNEWQPSDSTIGAWATQWKLPVDGGKGEQREIWLWDFGGQADQRLIHQLFMDETSLVVLVFDGQKDDILETLGQWDRDLKRAARKKFAKLLVAGRVDTGGLRRSRTEVEQFANTRNFSAFLETSARTNQGCEDLKQAILAAIHWEDIPCRTTEVIFKRLKDEIIRLRDDGRVLLRFNELRDALHLRLSGEFDQFEDEKLRAVLTLLAGPGVVWELAFGSFVLLQPERINAYAQAVIHTLQADEHQRGCLLEERVLKGDLIYESSMPRLSGEEERFVLLAMHQILVERGLCLRQPTAKGNLLVFPSFFRRERPEIVKFPTVLVSYTFSGFLDEIYATLVVRLHHTESFQQDQLWRYAADFKTNTGKQLGIKLSRSAPGVGELEVYFDYAVSVEEKIIFSKYVHEHLLQQGQEVKRLRHYVCPNCGIPVGNREVAMGRLNNWLDGQPPEILEKDGFKTVTTLHKPPTIICVGCEERVPLWDELEHCFASPEIKQRVIDLQKESDIELSNQSKERALVGDVISTVALADQISRELTVCDQGIDMEIEFNDDAHAATGKKLYLQLKSGDSYLRERKRDGAEIFTIKEERHARYWMDQAFPVLLVIRNSEGEVRWMEIRDWLKLASKNSTQKVRQIIFEGERFDVMSVRRWRDKILNPETATQATP